MNRSEIFGNKASFGSRYVEDHQELADLVGHCKGVGMKVVLTSGSFDAIHEGHMRYLERAKSCGDILIVGVDSDEKIAKRKKRTAVAPEKERVEILCHLRHVDVVTLKQASDERWELIKLLRPDALVIVSEADENGNPLRKTDGSLVPESYTDEEMIELKAYCGEVVILERQSTNSTSARWRAILIDGARKLKDRLDTAIDEFFTELGGGGDK